MTRKLSLLNLKRLLVAQPAVVRSSQSWSFHTTAMAGKEVTQLFVKEVQTACYAKYRPAYSSKIFEAIIKFYQETLNDFGLAVDIGCGSGQGTIPLASHFEKVVGLDVSEQQLKHTPRDVPNLSFHVSHAEDLSRFEPGTVDLVTVAQALHWFNQERFFGEVTRVLKPGGSLAAYGYGKPSLCLPAADALFSDVYFNVLEEYWPAERKYVNNKYKDFSLPYPQWRLEDSIVMEKAWTIDAFIGYLGSWTAVIRYNEINPGEDLLGQFKKSLKTLYNGPDDGVGPQIKVTWPIFILMGHKPMR